MSPSEGVNPGCPLAGAAGFNEKDMRIRNSQNDVIT
jgi:hypothetical protein